MRNVLVNAIVFQHHGRGGRRLLPWFHLLPWFPEQELAAFHTFDGYKAGLVEKLHTRHLPTPRANGGRWVQRYHTTTTIDVHTLGSELRAQGGALELNICGISHLR